VNPVRFVLLFAAAFAVALWWMRLPEAPISAAPKPAAARSVEARPARSAARDAAPVQPPPPQAAPAPAVPTAPPDPALASELRAQADALLKEGKVLDAIDAFEAALKADPSSARNHGDYGRLLRDLTAIDKALYHLRRAADLDPGNADRWIDLANAYYLKQDPGEAWKAEKRAREAEPDLKLRRNRRGLQERAGDTAPAGQ